MPATAARSKAAVPGRFGDHQFGNAAAPVDDELDQHAAFAAPMRALSGITESQLVRTAASTCTRYGLKSTPAGSLKSCRLLRAGPGDGA